MNYNKIDIFEERKMLLNDIRFEIQEVLFRFMRALDNKDWGGALDCLFDPIYCDYSSFRSEEPGQISRDNYIAKRKEALTELKTQHNLFNLLIQYLDESAEVRCNYVIYRFHPVFAGGRAHFFHSYGHYKFALKHEKNHWKISAITQILLTNDGNPELHEATRGKSGTKP
jgi:3-phenylpropionate/cinnamic acid dioxygenase small subunit